MKLLLTSNGFTDTIEDAFLDLLQKPPEKNRIGFITTAAFGEEHDPTWNTSLWLEEYRNQLRQRKFNDIEDVDLKTKAEEGLKKYCCKKI